MISTGDTLENPVTGERLTFVATSADTDGEYVLVEMELAPHGTVAAAHVHPYQSETFAILDGQVGFEVGGETKILEEGELAHVEEGTPHKFWNAGETTARFRTSVTPALGFEQLIETMFALAADGKTNRKAHAEPAPARGDRERAFRRRPPAVPAGLDAEGRSRPRSPARTAPRLQADVRARASLQAGAAGRDLSRQI